MYLRYNYFKAGLPKFGLSYQTSIAGTGSLGGYYSFVFVFFVYFKLVTAICKTLILKSTHKLPFNDLMF